LKPCQPFPLPALCVSDDHLIHSDQIRGNVLSAMFDDCSELDKFHVIPKGFVLLELLRPI
jgi:hypothetical protein